MRAVILEQVKIQDPQYRKERERYFINKFNTYYEGMNREAQRTGEALVVPEHFVLIIFFFFNVSSLEGSYQAPGPWAGIPGPLSQTPDYHNNNRSKCQTITLVLGNILGQSSLRPICVFQDMTQVQTNVFVSTVPPNICVKTICLNLPKS